MSEYKACAKIYAEDEKVIGFVEFHQSVFDDVTYIEVNLENVFPEGAHGIHIHQSGDMSNGCLSMGEHFNPFNKNHGGRTGSIRHTGDLGNVWSDENGVISEKFWAPISLIGPYSVLYRGLVIHQNMDDYGKGCNEESKKTGNSGARIACGVILPC